MTKDELRPAALAARMAVTDRASREAAARRQLGKLIGAPDGRTLAGYMPMRGEVDPLPFMCAWDGPVCVPVVVGRGRPLTFRRWSSDAPMIPGAFGAPVPAVDDTLVPDVVVVPLIAFTTAGDRLGYGGGFYDRTLSALPDADAVGLAFAVQRVATIPHEPTDVRLRAIATD